MDIPLAFDKQRVAMLYRSLPQNLVATFITAALLVYCLYETSNLTLALYWLTAIATVNLLRVPLLKVHRQLERDEFAAKPAAILFDLGVFFAGLCWGCAFLIIPNELSVATSYVAIFVACVMAVSCNSYQASFTAVLAFNSPIVLIVVTKFSLTPNTRILAVCAAIYAALLLINARRTAHRIKRELALQHNNSELIAQLAEEKQRTEDLNQVLEKKVEARTESLNRVNRELQEEIAEKESAQQELASINAKFSTLYDEHPSILLTLDEGGLLINVNQYGARYLGYPHSALLRMKFNELCTNGDQATKLLQRLVQEQSLEERGRLELVKSNGEVIAVQATFRRVDDELAQSSVIVVCEDVTEIDRLQKQLAYHASRDTLTGLYNRREFEFQINQLFERTKRHFDNHVLCIVDLDRFKVINDTSGHLAGDEILKSITAAMTECMRRTDILARLGGDEFGIIMEKTTVDDARVIIERLRDAIEKIEIVWDGVHHQVSASFGLTKLDANTESVKNVMRDADAACYLAKESGRNCIRIVDAENKNETQAIRKIPNWSTKLRQAVAEERLFLALQAVINQHTHVAQQHEALIRIQENDGSYSDAQLFIEAAERLGLVSTLDRWMFENALELLNKDSRFSLNACVSLNLAKSCLSDEAFCVFVSDTLSAKPDAAQKICLEIKESTLLYLDRNLSETINRFRNLGAKITVDDFGTSLAGFKQLDCVDVDFVKLDPLLIANLGKNSVSQEMLCSAIAVAQEKNIRPIAKGVTAKEQIAALLDFGVIDMQGYAVSQPVNIMSESLASLKQSA